MLLHVTSHLERRVDTDVRTAGGLAFIVVSQRLLQLSPGVAAALGALLGVERGVGEPRQSRRPALALEQRGGRAKRVAEPGDDVPRPLVSRIARVGVMPFITPAGRGSYKRPNFYFIYTASFRDAGARALYPTDDVFSTRSVEHFAGFGAEWWFGSTSYAR